MTNHESRMAECDIVVSKIKKRPYTRKLSDEDKKITNLWLSMRVVHLGKDGSRAKEKTLEYTHQPEEEVLQYIHQPEDKTPEHTPQSDNEMVKDNFGEEYEDDLQNNCDIVYVLLAEYDIVLEVLKLRRTTFKTGLQIKRLCSIML